MHIYFDTMSESDILHISKMYPNHIEVKPNLKFSDYLQILKCLSDRPNETIALINFMISVDSNPDQTVRDSKRVFERIMLSMDHNTGPGIGNFQEHVTLIIGEKPGKFKEGHGLKEFYGFASDIGSSLWLSRQLNSIKANEKDFYWVNALTIYGEEIDSSFIERLKPSKVITLGNIAHLWADKRGIEHFTAPHPAYWKRFHNKEEYPLLKIIKG